MAGEYYTIPEDPQYKADAVRKLKDSDPASATNIFNPWMEPVVETMAYLQKAKASLGEDGKVEPGQLPKMGASNITYEDKTLDDVLNDINQDISGLQQTSGSFILMKNPVPAQQRRPKTLYALIMQNWEG